MGLAQRFISRFSDLDDVAVGGLIDEDLLYFDAASGKIKNAGSRPVIRLASDWATLNSVLRPGQFGIESDTYNVKVGDGATAWNSLQYLADKENPWFPDGAICTPFDKALVNNNGVNFLKTLGLTSGTPRLCGGREMILPAGVPLKSMGVVCGTTDLAGGTHQWFATVRQSDLKILAITVDDVDQPWLGHTWKTLNVARYFTGGAMVNGSATLTITDGDLSQADVGKEVRVVGAGVAGAQLGNSNTPNFIIAVISPTQATLRYPAGTTVAGAMVAVATPYIPTADTAIYQAVMVAASTPPTLTGLDSVSNIDEIDLVPPMFGGFSTTVGLTTPLPVGTVLGAMTSTSAQYWGYPRLV